MFPLGLEPRTFRVLGGCDNHSTTETLVNMVRNYLRKRKKHCWFIYPCATFGCHFCCDLSTPARAIRHAHLHILALVICVYR